jgi:two-component system LytT family response regulator/two-component system response regulator LytT
MTNPDTWRRLALPTGSGDTLLFAPDEVYYLQAREHDSLVRTARRGPYRSSMRLPALEKRLPTPPFFRCHESYLVNLARVRMIVKRGRDLRLRLDPPVNKLIPVARARAAALRRLLGVR